MSSKCAIIPKVKNKKGEHVDSKLFKDLLHYTGNREITKQYYAVGKGEEFLSMVSNQANFDENGEITFQSLRKLANLNLGEETIRETLNKDLGSGLFSYDEAVPKMQSFNRSNPYNDKYLATLEESGDGRVYLNVVKRTPANESRLRDLISNRSLQDRIKFYLNRAGADYTFIEEKGGTEGRYSTINATRTADGLYQLIKVANNEKVDSNLAEEAGHFAVGALGNSPLVQRLINALTPEVQQQIMGEEYSSIEHRKSPSREVAGYLVGRAIGEGIDERTPLANLVHRVVGQIKKVFNKIKGDEVANAKLEAIRTAEDIARGFMSTTFTGNAETALETKETLYSSRDSVNVAAFKNVLAHLRTMQSELNRFNKDKAKTIKLVIDEIEAGNIRKEPSLFADLAAASGLEEALSMLEHELPIIIEKLNNIGPSIDPSNTQLFRDLREVRTFVDAAASIIKIISDGTLEGSSSMFTGFNEETLVKLKKAKNAINDMVTKDGGLLQVLELKEREAYSRFLSSILGSNFIDVAARKLFKRGKLVNANAERLYIDDLLRYLPSDITYFERYVASMSNNSDLIGQIADKANKMANKVADDFTIEHRNKLRVLQKKLEDIGLSNTDIFCEVSPRTKQLTGNVVSEYIYGDWENDWLEFKKNAQEEFKANTKLEGLSELEQSALFADWFTPKRKKWHYEHSMFDDHTQKWVPNYKYKSDFYTNNIKGTPKEQWLKEYMELMEELHSKLPKGSISPYRMPQFKGTTANKIRNRMMNDSAFGATGRTLRRNLADMFVEDSEDTEFGSALTYNTISEDMFSDQLQFEREKMNRLPLYGINKLKDPSDLSTDLFQSTLAFAGMANSFQAMSSVVDALEVGREVLKRRRVKGLKEESKAETSRAFTRYSKFMDMQVYNVYQRRLNFGRLAIHKIAGTLTGVATKVALGGNVLGGIANLQQGAVEIFKEALGGQHFSMKDYLKAQGVYYKNLPSNWIHAGDDIKEDFVSLFIDKMNALNDNRKRERDFFTRKSKIVKLNPFGENVMMPYKAGEHYMQSLTFLALGEATKLIDSNNNPISLLDSFEIKGGEDGIKRLEIKEGIKVLDKETGELRDWNWEDESNFMNKAREINNRMHGIYNNMDKVAIQGEIWGKAILAMRGYALGMLERRISANKASAVLDTDSEGSMNTVLKVLLTFGGKGEIGKMMRTIFLPVTPGAERIMLEAGFSSSQYRNMRRNFGDMLILGVAMLLKTFTAKPGGDDDDKKKKRRKEEDDDILMGTIYYFASRLTQEQSAFNTPWGLDKELPSVASYVPVGYSIPASLVDIGYQFVTQDEYKSSGATYKKGELKWVHKAERLLPFYRSWLLLQNPYKAAESYEYGRATFK